MTPAPEPEPEPVFQLLKPARLRAPISLAPGAAAAAATIGASRSRAGLTVYVKKGTDVPALHSSDTFGRRSFSRASRGSMTLDELGSSSSGSLTPIFKRIHNSEKEKGHKCSSLIPPDHRESTNTSKQSTRSDWSSTSSYGNPLADSYAESSSVPITRERRRALGMSGTMGGSTGPESDESDPDSDVRDLRFLLATHSNHGSVVESLSPRDEDEGLATAKPILDVEMLVARTASPRVPDVAPILQLPTFRASLIDKEDNHLDIDDGSVTSDEDTKKSFDFTGELEKLNESGVSDRRSFVEQLENVFRTPAEVDLCYDFGGHLRVEVPPVPSIPVDLRMAVEADSSAGTSTMETLDSSNSQSQLLNPP